MKNEPLGEKQTRRDFLGTSAVLATGAFLPFSKSYGSSNHVTGLSAIQKGSALSSNFGGVQIGAITYSFRDLEGGLAAKNYCRQILL